MSEGTVSPQQLYLFQHLNYCNTPIEKTARLAKRSDWRFGPKPPPAAVHANTSDRHQKNPANVTCFTVRLHSLCHKGFKAVILLSIPMIVRPIVSHVSARHMALLVSKTPPENQKGRPDGAGR